MFRISDSTGPLQVTQVATGSQINKSLLASDDVFLLDIASAIYVWVGKNASALEKKSGLQIATNYLVQHQLAASTPISRILDGGVNAEFYQYLV